jgi:hypothetical protein
MPRMRHWNDAASERHQTPSPGHSPTMVTPKAPPPTESWWATADRQGFTAQARERWRTEVRDLLPQVAKWGVKGQR